MDSIPRSESASKPAFGLRLTDQSVMRLRWAAAVGWTLVILLVCWMPKTVVKEAEGRPWLNIPHLDKVVHGVIFVVFGILWLRAQRTRSRSGYAWVVLLGVVVAVVSELGQNMPWVARDASVADTLTDCAGVAIGILLAPFSEPFLRARGEVSLGRQSCSCTTALTPTGAKDNAHGDVRQIDAIVGS